MVDNIDFGEERQSNTLAWKESRLKLEKEHMDMILRLAARFGSAVSIPSSNSADWVARKGTESLYTAFREIFPEVRSLLGSRFTYLFRDPMNDVPRF